MTLGDQGAKRWFVKLLAAGLPSPHLASHQVFPNCTRQSSEHGFVSNEQGFRPKEHTRDTP